MIVNIRIKIGDWYRDLERRQLDKVSPIEREQILAFDRSLKENLWRILSISLASYLALAELLHWVVPKLSRFESYLVVGLVAFSLGILVLSAWFGYRRVQPKTLARGFLAAVLGGTVGVAAALLGKQGFNPDAWDAFFVRNGLVILVAGMSTGLVYAVLMASLARFRNREYGTLVAQYESQAREATLARQLTEARLKLMQAQVEPHFLFNTLASVQQLAEAEGRAHEAAKLTAQLISFLRAGLSGLREEKATLQREFDMVKAYLSIMKTRMGERLNFHVDLPDALAGRGVPPAMLISLVENAIKHGLEPKPEGGTMWVCAAAENGGLVLSVHDDGLGLATVSRHSGGGVGLANIRERLRALYGDSASLTLAENTPQGFVATLKLPEEKNG